MVFLVFSKVKIMVTLQEQIRQRKEDKKEKLKDLFFVDYCNNCKDAEIRGKYGKHYTPCHHPWYCWHDGGEVQKLEARLGEINHMEWLYPFLPAKEREERKQLQKKKWELIKQGRRNMPRIKH